MQVVSGISRPMKSFPIALLILASCFFFPSTASSQTSFTRTYQLGGGIEVACCSKGPMSWGFTPVIQDTSLSGSVQITSISASDSGNILATDPNGVAGTTWEIFVGSTPCGFPVGEVQGVIQLGTYSCTAPTQLIFNTNLVFPAPGSTGTYAASFNFGTSTFTTVDSSQLSGLVLGTTAPTNLNQGLFLQILLWGGDVGADLQLSNITVTVTGTLIPTQGALLGASGSTTNPTASFAEPVNTATGNYYSSSTDLAVEGRGMPFIFNRYYNSLDTSGGPMGPGWTHTYNVLLTQDPSTGAVTVRQHDGSSVSFAMSGPGVYSAATPGLFDKLNQNPDGSFTLTRPSQLRLNFTQAGKLTSVVDRNGNTQGLTYDTAGDLTTITDTVGRAYTLTYDSSHRVVSLSDPTGRSVSYTYNDSGNLASVTNAAGGTTQYTYNSAGRISAASDPRGITYVQNTYDASGRVVSQKNGRGVTTSFAYSTPVTGTTTITDGNGNTLQHLYDPQLRLIALVDGNGATSSFKYNSENEHTSITDPNGNTTTVSYDGSGNITSVLDATKHSSSFVFDGLNDLTQITDANQNIIILSYDLHGNLASITDPLKNVTSMSYDLNGDLLQVTDPGGDFMQFGWDSAGNRVSFTDGAGRKIAFGYDSLGRLTSFTNAYRKTGQFQYDKLNRIVGRVDQLGNRSESVFDAVGNLASATDTNGHITSYSYDQVNNLTVMTDALGRQTAYSYDSNNNLVAVKNARENTTSYSYDSANHRIQITDPLGRQTHFSYDLVGNLIDETFGNGKSKIFTYDAVNQLLKVLYGDGSAVMYTYDADGNRLTMEDGLGTTSYQYDALNRLLQLVRFDGKQLSYTYSAAGKRASMTYPDGRTVRYKYDGSHKLTSLIDWAGNETQYTYDQAARLSSTSLPNGIRSDYTYDGANRLVSLKNSSGLRTLSSFLYTLDNVGNRIAVESKNEGLATYQYDALNQLVGSTDCFGKNVNYLYDEVGNRTSMKTKGETLTYAYSRADELLSVGAYTFSYDGTGNRISAVKFGMKTSYTWNSANRLAEVAGPKGTISFAYDGDGNRISSVRNNHHRSYVNDVRSRYPEAIAKYSGESTTDFVRGMDLVAAIEGSKAKYVDYDALDSTANSTDFNGGDTTSYSFDPWGQLLREGRREEWPDGRDDVPVEFAGHIIDKGDDIYYMRARFYDPAVGRFLSPDPLGARFASPYDQNRYAYARNNPLRFVDPSGLSAEANMSVPDAFGTRLAPRIKRGLGPSGASAGAPIGASAVVATVVVGIVCVLQPELCGVLLLAGEAAVSAAVDVAVATTLRVVVPVGIACTELPEDCEDVAETISGAILGQETGLPAPAGAIGALDTSLGALDKAIREYDPGVAGPDNTQAPDSPPSNDDSTGPGNDNSSDTDEDTDDNPDSDG